MMLRAFSSQRQSSVIPIKIMKSSDYRKLLKEYFLPFGELLGGSLWMFQQDNASCHASKPNKEWFSKNNVQVID